MNTALYAALLGLLLCALSANVIRARRAQRVAIGDGGKADMQRSIRAQANCAEYAPIFLILLALAEFQGLPWYGVHLLGVAFFAGRLFHAYGLGFKERYEKNSIKDGHYRARGMLLTFVPIVATACILLVQVGATLIDL